MIAVACRAIHPNIHYYAQQDKYALVPYLERGERGEPVPLAKYALAFEELENSLHPALLRRLLSYIREKAVSGGCTVFLTTHSGTVIDFFAGDDEAQIVQVVHDGQTATVRRLTEHRDCRDAVADLGMRPSDLLLANCLVWVEGPSDRIYFNRWMEQWSEGQLREGSHYQCVLYGGSAFEHLKADDASSQDAVNLLKVSGNIILIMDSDRTAEGKQLSDKKRRLKREVAAIGGLVWVTDGRAIENYLPTGALAEHFHKNDLNQVGRFQEFDAYLDGIQKGAGRDYRNDKVHFARRLCPHLTREHLATVLDLAERLDGVCAKIRKWNGMTDGAATPAEVPSATA